MIFPEIFAPYQDPFHPENSQIFAGFCGSPENFASEISQKFLQENGLQNAEIFRPHQTHSNIVFSTREYPHHPENSCDGVYTRQKNELCFVKTADCIGAIFYHPEKKLGATIHAGWRGLAQKIFSAFLHQFSPEEISGFRVALSPSLGKCCAEFSDPYRETPDFFHPFISEISGKYYVDLWSIAQNEFVKNGIPPSQIELPAFCTKCGCSSPGKDFQKISPFWSHRNADKERNGTFFLMK